MESNLMDRIMDREILAAQRREREERKVKALERIADTLENLERITDAAEKAGLFETRDRGAL